MTTFTALIEVTTFLRVEFESADNEAPAEVAIATAQAGAGFRELPARYAVAQIARVGQVARAL